MFYLEYTGLYFAYLKNIYAIYKRFFCQYKI